MRKFFAFMLIIFPFLPVALCAMFTNAVGSSLLDRNFYTSLLDDERLYDVLVDDVLVDLVNQQVASTGLLPQSALIAGLREVITADYLRTETLSIVNSVFDALEGQTRTAQIALNIAPLKQAVTGAGRERFSRAYAEALPTCDATKGAPPAGAELLTCRPPEITVEAATAQVAANVPTFAASLPDTIRLGEPIDLQSDLGPAGSLVGEDVRAGVASVTTSLALGAIILWLLIGFIAARSGRELVRWLGYGALIPAVLVGGLALSLGTLSAELARTGLGNITINGTRASPEFAAALGTLLGTGLDAINAPILTISGLVFVIGIVLFLLSFVLPGRRQPHDDDFYYSFDDKPKRDGDKPKRTIP